MSKDISSTKHVVWRSPPRGLCVIEQASERLCREAGYDIQRTLR